MGRPVVKLADKFVEWSTVVDAPVSWAMTRAEAAEQFGEERVASAELYGHSLVDNDGNPASGYEDGFAAFNRAGPEEECLTVDAVLRRFESAEAYEKFELNRDDIQPHLTSAMRQRPDGSWEHSEPYWVPWPPAGREGEPTSAVWPEGTTP